MEVWIHGGFELGGALGARGPPQFHGKTRGKSAVSTPERGHSRNTPLIGRSGGIFTRRPQGGSRAQIQPRSFGIAPNPEERLPGPPPGTPMRAWAEPFARRPHGGCRVRMHFPRGSGLLGLGYPGFYRADRTPSPRGSPKDPGEATSAPPRTSPKRGVENIVKTAVPRNSRLGSPGICGVAENRAGKGTVNTGTSEPRGAVSASEYGVSRFPEAKLGQKARIASHSTAFRHAVLALSIDSPE